MEGSERPAIHIQTPKKAGITECLSDSEAEKMVRQNKPRLDVLKKELLLHLKNHIVAVMRIRNEIYAMLKMEFHDRATDFFNLTTPDRHIRMLQLMLASLEMHKPYQHLQDAFALWDQRLAPAVFAHCNDTERQKYGYIAKILAACLFDSDEYTKAVVCLGHVVRLQEDDVHSRLLLLYWLCLLGHWSLAKTLLRRERDTRQPCTVHNEIIAEVVSAIIHLRTEKASNSYPGDASSEQKQAFETMQYFENVLNKAKSKTFQQYEAQILIKQVLVAASHYSSADLTLVGDPLQNMDYIKARYETLVKCRSDVFFGSNGKVDDKGSNAFDGLFLFDSTEFQEKKIDEYLKLNAAMAEHFQAIQQMCLKYVELGILRESESEGLKLLHQVLKTANLQRCLAVLNVLCLLSTLGRGSCLNARPNLFRTLVACLWNRNSRPTKRTSRSVKESVRNNVPITPSGNQEIIDLCGDEPNNLQPANKEDGDSEKLVLTEHDENCSCAICSLCVLRPQMRMNVIFAKFLFQHFSSKTFRSFPQRIQELPFETSLDVTAICSALRIEETDDAVLEGKYPVEALEIFLIAAIRWLRRVGEEEKSEIVQEVIRESLKICLMEPVRFRWQWLTIRQLARPPLKIPRLEWLRAQHASPLKAGLRSPLKSIVNNLASELNSLTLCSPRPARNLSLRTETPLRRTAKSNSKTVRNDVLSRSNAMLEEAKKDFDSFSHLFYREWRFQTCSYLGQACAFHPEPDWSEPGWSAAYYFTEAMSISTRQLARMIVDKSEENQVFHFENIEKFKEAVRSLPSDLTVVQLFLDARRILWLIRLYHSRPPLVVPIAFLAQDDALLKRFSNLLSENDESGHLGKTCTDAKKYWAIRRRLDQKLKVIIGDLEAEWFEIFAVLLLPCTTLNDAQHSIMEEMMNNGFSESTATVLAENLDLKACDWKRLVQKFVILEGLDESVLLHVCDCRSRWVLKFKKGSFDCDLSNSYVLFNVPPELASIPFELLPVMESHQRVCRISSFHMFQKLLSRSKKIPKAVDGRNSFYVLDPGNDLTDTQKRLSKELQKYTYWKGIIGAAPKPEELRKFLETNDLFFYMGHGSGGRYFGRSAVLRSNCRAVSLLMGCSSVRVVHEGEGFDGRGAVNDYVIAQCPCVVGCLWMVTDGEIDKVLLALLNFCFSEIEKQQGGGENDASSSYRLLIDAIAHARNACKLKYMTGGAVVAYGLPIMTHLSEHEETPGQQLGREELPKNVTGSELKSREALETRLISSGKPSFC